MSDTPNEPVTGIASSAATDQSPAQPAATPVRQSGVTMQKPLIIGLLYLLNIVLGFSVFVGLILAYVWRSEADVQEWEKTHYTYLIRTFWISFAIGFVAFFGWFAMFFGMVAQTDQGAPPDPAFFVTFFGFIFVWFILAGWFCVRCVLSLSKSGSQKPMPKPETWLF